MLASTPPAPLPLPPKPLGLPELLDKAFTAYRRNFVFFAAIAVLCMLPDLIVEMIWGSGSLLGATRLIFAPYALALLYISATQVVIWNEANLKAVMRAALQRYVPFAGLVIAYILAALGLIIFPLGIWLFVLWAPAAPALAAEPINPNAAIRRSTQLVKGVWWRCFLTMATVLILVGFVAFIMAASAGVAMSFVPGLSEDVSLMLVGSASLLAASLATPLAPIAFSLLYVDLRVRKEGFELDYLAKSAADAA